MLWLYFSFRLAAIICQDIDGRVQTEELRLTIAVGNYKTFVTFVASVLVSAVSKSALSFWLKMKKMNIFPFILCWWDHLSRFNTLGVFIDSENA